MKGHFVVQKSSQPFSSIALDQAKVMVELLVCSRDMIGGPELARVIFQFEESIERLAGGKNGMAPTKHHEQTRGTQSKFAMQVQNLVEAFEEMGNPFTEDGEDLLRIDTTDMADSSAIKNLQDAENTGTEQYQDFVKQ